MGNRLRQPRKHLGRELGLHGRSMPAQPRARILAAQPPPRSRCSSAPRSQAARRLTVHRRRPDHSMGDRGRRERYGLGRQFRLSVQPAASDPDWPAPNRVSHFCGVDTSKCPPTKRGVGKAISPDGTGYTSDALVRNTAVAIDPSGNVWLANNWKRFPILNVSTPAATRSRSWSAPPGR